MGKVKEEPVSEREWSDDGEDEDGDLELDEEENGKEDEEDTDDSQSVDLGEVDPEGPPRPRYFLKKWKKLYNELKDGKPSHLI